MDRSKLDVIVLLLSAALGDFIIFGLLGSHWWVFDLFANFIVYYFVVALLAILYFIFRGNYVWMLLPLAIALITGWMVFSVYIHKRQDVPKEATARMRIMSYNVYSFNTQYDAIADYVHETNPDVIVFPEITKQSYNELTARLPEYPYNQWEDGISLSGDVAFFSKESPDTIDILNYDENVRLPIFRLKFTVDNNSMILYGIHPAPPMSSSLHTSRTIQLDGLAEKIKEDTKPVVVVGDFNTTPWSPVFRKFLSSTGLHDTRNGFGMQSSWPTWLPEPLRIPIDHALISNDMYVVDRFIGTSILPKHSQGGISIMTSARNENKRTIGPKSGSDHLPVLIDIAF